MKKSLALFLVGLGPLVSLDPSLKAQETNDATSALPSESGTSNPPTTDEIAKAIAQKEAEIALLKKQLEQAKSEIQSLSTQNQQLKASDTTLKTEIQASPDLAIRRPDPAPLTSTPEAAGPLNSMDVFWYFHNSPDAANQYLKGKRITVSGKLVGFDAPIVRRVFGLLLESGDPNLRVTCKFGIPEVYAGIFFRRQVGAIIGRTPAGAEDVLLNLNTVISVEGQCDGLDDGDVALSKCRLIQ